jgi:alkylation response protein AidB-like acyl-CoA dehydrogenase
MSDATAQAGPQTAGSEADNSASESGARIDVAKIVDELTPMILEYEERIEAERDLPPDLVEAMYQTGALRPLLPREYGGLECHPLDYLELVYQLARLNGSVGWLAMVQNGAAVLLHPDVMKEVVPPKRWVTAGSAGRVCKAYLAEAGLRVTGRWPFASGTPHSTFIQALVQVVDENDKPILGEETGKPQVANVVFPREDVTYHDTWNGLGLRGTSSGDIEVTDVFVPDGYVQYGPWIDEAYTDRPLYRFQFGMQGHAAHALGVARGSIDAFIELTHRNPNVGSPRQRMLGREQLHKIGLAKADAMVRAARLFAWDATQKTWDQLQTQKEADYELRVQTFESGIYGVRTAREALQMMFDHAGTDSVFRGKKLERCYRDLSTAAQHAIYAETYYQAIGEYYMTRDRPDGIEVDEDKAFFGPPPADDGPEP